MNNMSMEEKIDVVFNAVITMQQDMSEIKDRMTNMEGRIIIIEGEIKEIRKDINAMNDDVAFLVKKTMDNSADIRQLKLVK